jgi:hypothetical protein
VVAEVALKEIDYSDPKKERPPPLFFQDAVVAAYFREHEHDNHHLVHMFDYKK